MENQQIFLYMIVVPVSENTRILSAEELKKEFPNVDFDFRECLRDELYGQPKLPGFNGPMWGGFKDGVPVIRYEHSKS